MRQRPPAPPTLGISKPAAIELVGQWMQMAHWFAMKSEERDPYSSPAAGLFLAALDLADRAGVRWEWPRSFILFWEAAR